MGAPECHRGWAPAPPQAVGRRDRRGLVHRLGLEGFLIMELKPEAERWVIGAAGVIVLLALLLAIAVP